ncbi:hypothetical protein P3S68_003802 [Capsicum galapagoense]
MYSMPPYSYLATDYGTQLSLFTHHMWIGGFLIVGAAAHAAIFMVRDYDPTTRYNDLLDRVLRHRDAIISHLNWACIFLGFLGETKAILGSVVEKKVTLTCEYSNEQASICRRFIFLMHFFHSSCTT